MSVLFGLDVGDSFHEARRLIDRDLIRRSMPISNDWAAFKGTVRYFGIRKVRKVVLEVAPR